MLALVLVAAHLLNLAADLGGTSEPAQAGSDGTWIVDGVGDGVHDDTPAIQQALDAAIAAGGGTISLPKRGPYLITRPLVICPQNPGRTFEDSWPPSTMHFASFASVRLTSPAHAILRACNKSQGWPAFDSNLTSGMLLIGVAVNGGGCTSNPLYSEIDSIQFEGTAPFTPSAWASNPTPPAYPLIAPKAAIVADWAYHLTIRRVSITSINIGIYMKGVDNARVESNVVRANHCIIAEDCGDSSFYSNDLYPFGWGFIFRAWSGDTQLQRNVVTGMPLVDPSNPDCALARAAFPSQAERQCDERMRLPASGGVLVDNEASSCAWANNTAVFSGLWPHCPSEIKGQGHATGITIGQGQFHGLRSVLVSLGNGSQASRQLTLRGNNLMSPLGALGFTMPDPTQPTGVQCDFVFPCERCVCANNVMIG